MTPDDRELREEQEAAHRDKMIAQQKAEADPLEQTRLHELEMVKSFKRGTPPRPWYSHVKHPDNRKIMVNRFLATLKPSLTPVTIANRKIADPPKTDHWKQIDLHSPDRWKEWQKPKPIVEQNMKQDFVWGVVHWAE